MEIHEQAKPQASKPELGHYLYLMNMPVGLIMNFSEPPLRVRRVGREGSAMNGSRGRLEPWKILTTSQPESSLSSKLEMALDLLAYAVVRTHNERQAPLRPNESCGLSSSRSKTASEGRFPGLVRAIRICLDELLPESHIAAIEEIAAMRVQLKKYLPDASVRFSVLRRLGEELRRQYFARV